MTKTLHCFSAFLLAMLISYGGYGQVSLGASPYVEQFNNISGGLPTGFSVVSGSSATALGNPATYNSAVTNWNSTTGRFANYASATGLASNTTTTVQSATTNRALGLRQTAALGDPGGAFVFQIANTSNRSAFKLSFLLQSLDVSSPRKTIWSVDYGIGAAPSSFIPVTTNPADVSTGASSFLNTEVTADFGNALNNINDVVTIRIVVLSSSTGSGNRPTSAIDDFNLSWTDGNAPVPSLTVNDNGSTSIGLPATPMGSSSAAGSYVIKGENLTGNIDVTAPAPFYVSLDNNTFTSSVTINAADETSDKTVYVRVTPVAAGIFNGTITNSSSGASDKIIAVSAEGYDPNNLDFKFNTCSNNGTPGAGFNTYSVSGAQNWTCTSFGRNNTNGVNINGYSGGPKDNEDWLISPSLSISNLNLPVLSFWSRGEFSGPSLQLLISTDYDGVSNPNTATWTDLNAGFPITNNTWTFTDGINLSAYKSAAKVYIAFKYISSVDLGAARWTLDDVLVSDRNNLFYVHPFALTFNTVPSGSKSASETVGMQAINFGDITVNAPANFEVSADNSSFSNQITIPQAAATAGTSFYVRFAPSVKAIMITDTLQFTGTGLLQRIVSLSGSSYPKDETFDVAAYNLSFFGSNSTNNPTPEKITTQINNIATVIQRLDMDVIGVEEVSSDSAFNVLLTKLPGYAGVLSDRWSHSFDPPDPAFPPQKTGFIYKTSTMKLSTIEPPRVMFASLYDSLRNGTSHQLDDYPSGDPSSFWSSGRLPIMATFTANINGDIKTVRIIDLHAKASSDVASYKRRQYDAKVLKDSLDSYYKNDILAIVGDFNDRVDGSIYGAAGATSPYKPFVDDTADYATLTYPLDSSGATSFIGGNGLIDQIIVSKPLAKYNIANATTIEDARSYIPNYGANTASDHLPIYSRFSFGTGSTIPVTLIDFTAEAKKSIVQLTWSMATEKAYTSFTIQRSADDFTFTDLAIVNGRGASTSVHSYVFTDDQPLNGVNYYRLILKDGSGNFTYSKIVSVRFGNASALVVFPNPVTNFIQITTTPEDMSRYNLELVGNDGRVILKINGNIGQINQQLNDNLSKIAAGIYTLSLQNGPDRGYVKIVKQ